MTVAQFPKNKRYTDFAPLLADIAKAHPDIKSGVIVLFDEDGAAQVLPVCTRSQMAYAAAIMLKEAAE